MSIITITLPEPQWKRLQEIAARFGIAPEELLRLSLEHFLAQTEPEFEKTLKYVLSKNEELYRRLA
ncbi:hypothetical protein ARMA_2065 [Ardenticatena maritima]|uniref:DNA-binding protein n=1 Tax=Ardenticatena maritima TaxID=872965 RepID=A0A0M8K9S0_9CHLR|nr:hypothetical protein [Ardenticatena maritima]KPL87992.1 DNA-binding protein [Ardenticatena maritima]GAP63642.1 hypothetical protein ARMA_2065 [Ardenticatena maritima]